jgi:hypothetical protein
MAPDPHPHQSKPRDVDQAYDLANSIEWRAKGLCRRLAERDFDLMAGHVSAMRQEMETLSRLFAVKDMVEHRQELDRRDQVAT